MKDTVKVIYDEYVKHAAIAAEWTLKRDRLYELFVENCDHSETEVDEQYSPGTYYDKAEWTSYERCVYCKKRLRELKRETGSYG